ncbi:MAG: hypothetical protein ACOCWR_09495 [Oceanidesulfovibrio sp.]
MDHATMLQDRCDVLGHMLAPERTVRQFLRNTHPTNPESMESAERIEAALNCLFGRLVNIIEALAYRFTTPLTYVPGAMACRFGMGSEKPTVEDPWARCAVLVEDTRLSLADASTYIRPIPLEPEEEDDEQGPPLFLTLGEELFRAVNTFLNMLRQEWARPNSDGVYVDLITVLFEAECEALFGLHRLLSMHFGELHLMYDADEYEAATRGEPRIPVLLFEHEYEAVKDRDTADSSSMP